MNASALLLLASSPLWAHDYPIAPVRVVLSVEPGRTVVDIKNDSIYWIEEVTGDEKMPPKNWPAEDRNKVEAYVGRHFRLSADGRELSGKLVDAEWVQRPWQVNEQGEFRLRFVYPSIEGAKTLSGEGAFFAEYLHERLQGGEPIMPTMDFRTLVEVPGMKAAHFELKPRASSFQIPVADARRGTLSLLLESFVRGASAAASSMEGWAALAALALSLGTRSSWAFAALLAGLAVPAPNAAAAAWLAGVPAAVAAGRWFGEGSSPWLESAALAALGSAWAGAALAWLPGSAPGLLERLLSASGASLSCGLLLISCLLVVESERRRAANDSASSAAMLFNRRRRLAALALLLVSALGAAQELG